MPESGLIVSPSFSVIEQPFFALFSTTAAIQGLPLCSLDSAAGGLHTFAPARRCVVASCSLLPVSSPTPLCVHRRMLRCYPPITTHTCPSCHPCTPLRRLHALTRTQQPTCKHAVSPMLACFSSIVLGSWSGVHRDCTHTAHSHTHTTPTILACCKHDDMHIPPSRARMLPCLHLRHALLVFDDSFADWVCLTSASAFPLSVCVCPPSAYTTHTRT